MSGKREDYISWDTYFMLTALLAKDRSKDPKTQVGAIIVKDNHILSTGYNGTPKGLSDDDMPWDSLGEETGEFIRTKNAFVVHSEANALSHYRGNTDDFIGAKLYVSLFPCNECAKLIVNSGISEVVHLQDYRHTDKAEASMLMFKAAGVTVRKLNSFDEMKKECQELIDFLNSVKTNEPFVRKIEYKNKQ